MHATHSRITVSVDLRRGGCPFPGHFLSVSLKGSYVEAKVPMATNICTVVLEVHVEDITRSLELKLNFSICLRPGESSYFHLRN